MLILYHGQVYQRSTTGQPGSRTALAVQDGKIAAVGSDAEILAQYGSRARQVDLNGAVVWPGLTDAHIHLEYYALGLQHVDCETDTLAECLRRVSVRAQEAAKDDWIIGHGWNQNIWPEGFGSAAMLDAVSGGHPVFLTSKSIHSAWINSRAMQIAGIAANTPDPPGGAIQRDAAANPTGILLEGAMGLVMQQIPQPTIHQLSEALLRAQENLWRMGITGVHDFDSAACFSALQLLHQSGKLKLRVIKNLQGEQLAHAAAMGLRTGFGDDFLRVGSLKFFADGALGPHTAAMLNSYKNSPEEMLGILLLEKDQVVEFGQQAVKAGFSLAIHAIGDRANREIIDAYTQLRTFERQNGLPHYRHRIEHVQLLHPKDISRLASQHILASMQPIHATSDMQMADLYWGDRSQFAYAWNSIHQAGAALAFGSDAPVESPNPFFGLHAAVTRRRVDGTPGENGWYPEQRLSLETALAGFTTGAAYAGGMENTLGKLEPGFAADLIVLERDPFQIPPDELYSIQPSATMVAGEWVSQKSSQEK